MTEAHVVQSVRALQQLVSGIEVDGLVVVVGVVVALVHVHIDPAERVHDIAESVEADLQIVIDVHPGRLLDGRDGQRWAPEREGGVEFTLAVSGDVHPQVPGQ